MPRTLLHLLCTYISLIKAPFATGTELDYFHFSSLLNFIVYMSDCMSVCFMNVFLKHSPPSVYISIYAPSLSGVSILRSMPGKELGLQIVNFEVGSKLYSLWIFTHNTTFFLPCFFLFFPPPPLLSYIYEKTGYALKIKKSSLYHYRHPSFITHFYFHKYITSFSTFSQFHR